MTSHHGNHASGQRQGGGVHDELMLGALFVQLKPLFCADVSADR